MRVTIIGPAYPLRGGIAHHVYYLKRELTSRGHSVQVVSFRKLYPTLFFPGTSELDQSTLRLDPEGLGLLTPTNPFTWLKAYRVVKAFKPDVVIFQWWHPFFGPMVGTLARLFRRANLKSVIECHNVFPHERNVFDTSLLKFAAKPATSFITHSSQDRDKLSPFASGKPIRVAGLPMLREFTGETNHERRGNRILFFGVVRKYKGLRILLEAMPKILSRVDCRLEIVGEFYDPVANYVRLIKDLDLEKQVSIDNRYIPNELVPEVMARADVLVLPYLSATQSGVARIALSNGLPVIASRTGGLSEVVTEGVNGLLTPPGDANGLADCVVRYFAEDMGPVFAKNLSKAAEEPATSVIEHIESAVADDLVEVS